MTNKRSNKRKPHKRYTEKPAYEMPPCLQRSSGTKSPNTTNDSQTQVLLEKPTNLPLTEYLTPTNLQVTSPPPHGPTPVNSPSTPGVPAPIALPTVTPPTPELALVNHLENLTDEEARTLAALRTKVDQAHKDAQTFKDDIDSIKKALGSEKEMRNKASDDRSMMRERIERAQSEIKEKKERLEKAMQELELRNQNQSGARLDQKPSDDLTTKETLGAAGVQNISEISTELATSDETVHQTPQTQVVSPNQQPSGVSMQPAAATDEKNPTPASKDQLPGAPSAQIPTNTTKGPTSIDAMNQLSSKPNQDKTGVPTVQTPTTVVASNPEQHQTHNETDAKPKTVIEIGPEKSG